LNSKPDCIIVYSGGLDSTVLLYKLRKEGRQLHALSFNYGQRHKKELACATEICFNLGIPRFDVDLPLFLFKGSSQTSAEIPVPLGHYADETMKQTVVPNRNMVMLALAGSYAISVGAELVAYAAHSGDHAIYPDCRPEFVEAVDSCFFNSDWKPPKLVAPFIHSSKADIVAIGHTLNVPFEKTWSCYQGKEFHCGKCGTCVERNEAFRLAEVEDPTIYAPEFEGGRV